MKETTSTINSILRETQNVTGRERLLHLMIELLGLRENSFHPLVFINGEPQIGQNVSIGLFSEINAKGSTVTIGDCCDIASFVSINVADSHLKCIEKGKEIQRGAIVIGDHVFIGSHSFIGRNTIIGHHSVIGAGTILLKKEIPPYSLVTGNPPTIKEGYYQDYQ